MENKQSRSKDVLCSCGLVILDGNIEYINKCNEDYDEYHEVLAICDCGKEYDFTDWGICENLIEAKKGLKDQIDFEC